MLHQKRLICLLSAAFLPAVLSGCSRFSASKSDPVTITVWTYYNGDQLESFQNLVQEFNDTVGNEKGIIVKYESQGTVNDLEKNVIAAATGEVGASDMPNIFSAYADTAYTVDQMNLVMDFSEYLSEEERNTYIDQYLAEGDFSCDGSMKIFPVAKSTELLFLNETDWEPFATATGASFEDLSTIEGLVATAELYYNWTDAQTSEKNDGRALFGRDAMANYMLLGSMELGTPIFDVENEEMTLHFEKEIAKKLWDHYYIPFIKGYFSASGRFRSDDIKTGNIIAYVGATSSATYFPTQVCFDDTSSHEIQLKVLPAPRFQNSENYAVQQGAGMVITKTDDEHIANACIEFLKWFTSSDHNISFSVTSGYLPVTKEANDMEKILESGAEMSDTMKQILSVAIEEVNTSQMYTTKAFPNGKDARSILEYALSDRAATDRSVIEERMAAGADFDKAAAEFLSDTYFDTWYQNTLTQLQQFTQDLR